MARIRTVKPEFWKSETIATLSIRTRLTFIALWNFVDDNGVGRDNDRLITSEIFPLEDDPVDALAQVRRSLDELAAKGRITRYTNDGRRYLHITNWSEHQKIDRPNKKRFPLPSDEGSESLTCTDTPVRRRLDEPSTNGHRALAPNHVVEQGAGKGIRDQGSGIPAEPGDVVAAQPDTQDLIKEWIDHQPKRPPSRVIGQISKEVKAMLAEDIPYADVRAGLAAWHQKGLHPSALASVVHETRTAPTRRPRSTTDDRVQQALSLAAQLEAMDAADNHHAIKGRAS